MKVTQSCLTLCNPMDCVHRILQARILEWVAFPFSRVSSQPRDQIQVSCISGEFFISWATREAQKCSRTHSKLLNKSFFIWRFIYADVLILFWKKKKKDGLLPSPDFPSWTHSYFWTFPQAFSPMRKALDLLHLNSTLLLKSHLLRRLPRVF